MKQIPRRRKNETLLHWLERIMDRHLANGDLVNAFWMGLLIRNVRRGMTGNET